MFLFIFDEKLTGIISCLSLSRRHENQARSKVWERQRYRWLRWSGDFFAKIFLGSAREAAREVFAGIVSERNFEPSVIEIWAMRDDGPPIIWRAAGLEILLRESLLQNLRA